MPYRKPNLTITVLRGLSAAIAEAEAEGRHPEGEGDERTQTEYEIARAREWVEEMYYYRCETLGAEYEKRLLAPSRESEEYEEYARTDAEELRRRLSS